MPTFIAIGYGDRAGYDRTEPAVRDRAHAQDEHLRRTGARIGRAGEPVQVRNADGLRVTTEHGAFLRSDLPVAGFTVIEATDIEHATTLLADTPCAVAHGVVELWPLLDESAQPGQPD